MLEAITIGLWSYHFDRSREANETHNLVGLQYEKAYVAHYENSYNRDSVIVARISEPDCWKLFCIDWMAGGVTGYEQRTEMKLTPFILPRFKLETVEDVNIYSLVIPGEVVAAGFEVRF